MNDPADPATMLSAVKRNGHALSYALPSLRDNDEIVLAAVKQDGFALSVQASVSHP
jgi:hypothetical protein